LAGDWQGNIFASSDPTAGSGAWQLVYTDASRLAIPISSMTEPAGITSIACASVTSCIASDEAGNVITTRNPTGGSSAWTLKPVLPRAGGPGGPYFAQITCPSVSRCVGVYGGQAAVSENPFDGGTWTQAAIDRGQALTGVSCPTVLLCVAIDNRGNAVVGRAVLLTTHQIRALVALQITPRGKQARIRELLRHGGFTVGFKAPMAGSVTIKWTGSPANSHSGRATRKRALVATGQKRYTAPGKATVRLALTRAGRGLLRRARGMKLTIQASFTPAAHRPITATRRITLRY
jgi:hypothetical protein